MINACFYKYEKDEKLSNLLFGVENMKYKLNENEFVEFEDCLYRINLVKTTFKKDYTMNGLKVMDIHNVNYLIESMEER